MLKFEKKVRRQKVKETILEIVDLINLAQDRDQWWAVTNLEVNLRSLLVHIKDCSLKYEGQFLEKIYGSCAVR